MKTRKRYILAVVLGALCSHLFAAYSTIETRRMAPGVVYKKMADTSKPWEMFLLEVDLSDPTVQLQSVRASNAVDGAAQTPGAMATAHSSNTYHNVIGAINGDFFLISTDETPRNIQVTDGQLLWDLDSVRSIFGITETKVPFVSSVVNDHTVVSAGGSSRTINHVNRARGTDDLVLYNSFIGGSTGTNTSGTEVKLSPVGEWRANGTVDCIVLTKTGSGSGNMSFSSGQAVLSGAGTAATFLNGNVNIGDTITLVLGGSSSTLTNITQVVGGGPKIVSGGVNYAVTGAANEGSPGDPTVRHPRTAVGFSQDNKTLYMVVVDGRRTGSAGMTQVELANFLIYLGCYTGINLDGGGSSAIIANGVVKNVPSDGSQRPVANALLVYNSTRRLDVFESGVGHFDTDPNVPTETVGIASSSTASHQTGSNVHSANGSLKVVLSDNTSSSAAWKVRLLSGSGSPSSNTTFNGRGTVSLWVKSSNAGSAAAVKLRIDDIDGTEETPGLTINSDGQWHRYTWDMETFNGTTVDTGNGFINTDATVTIDSIIFSQPNTAGTWTMYIDDFLHDREELNPGLVNIATSATLSACSFKTTSSNTYSVDKAVDRDRTSPASRWVSGADAEPHWFQLDWPSSRKINRVKVWSGSPSSPEHQIDDYKIQYWTGSAWSDVATVASNNRDSFYGAYNDLSFSEVTTSRLRIYITDASPTSGDTEARLMEIEVFSPNLAPEAQLSVDSTKTTYVKENAVDGNQTGNKSRWISTETAEPHWFQMDWATSQTISGVKLWTGSPISAGYEIDDFQIQYWTGSAWSTVATVTGNDKDVFYSQCNDLTFTPVSTDRLRVYITDASAQSGDLEARLLEIEVY